MQNPAQTEPAVIGSEDEPSPDANPRAAGMSPKVPTAWLYRAFEDWLGLLEGPKDASFRDQAKFESEWSRLFRLAALVLVLSSAGLGTPAFAGLGFSLEGLKKGWESMVLQSRPGLLLILGGSIAAAIYSAFFGSLVLPRKLQCVPMSFRQSFFTLLLLGLPWLPPLAVLIGLTKTSFLPTIIEAPLLVIAPYTFLLAFSRNFYRGVCTIHPLCSKWRVSISVIVPLAVLTLIIINRVF